MLGRLSRLSSLNNSLLLAVPVFASAWLLFAIEPMLAKLLLPTLGGSPATWAACLVAFQLLLLAGYAYAHGSARLLSVRGQTGVHALLLVFASVGLLQARLGATPDLGSLPLGLSVPWFVLRRIGAPFVVLASTAPLLARWARPLKRSGHALYSVSNAGALAGLLAYPLLLERFVALPVQFSMWAAGFVLFGLSLLPVCAVVALRGGQATKAVVAPRWSLGRRLYGLACAAVPSALLLAVTSYISVDVAATPLLWVVPLALYLTSFIVAFSKLNLALRGPALVLWITGSLWLSLNAFAQGAVPLFSQVTPALLALFGASVLCHGELSHGRPGDDEPTGYFLLLASGGVLGGAFVSLLAPLIFADFYELEVASAATFVLLALALRRRDAAAFSRNSRRLVYLGCGLCLPLLGAEAWLRHGNGVRGGQVVERVRGFLGPLRVVDVAEGRVLTHGRIQHGMQLRGAQRRLATMYFGAGTAVQRVLGGVPLDRPRRIGVVGLGVGTLASYGRHGDTLRFYELDANVIDLARRDFTFLRDSAAEVTLVLGDGRLALARETPHAFDVLVLDAFSSDAVPVHLLTRQAFEIYARQLGPNGILLANVSNRHLAVERVVRASARAVGLSCFVVETQKNAREHRVHVVWAIMAREPALVTRLLGDLPLKAETEPEVLWTDSRASVLSVLR